MTESWKVTDHELPRVETRMAELCDRYGLTLADLNIDLGPLGTLLPP
nr:gas vesicle protein GvpK [Streptomyces brasiliensis]